MVKMLKVTLFLLVLSGLQSCASNGTPPSPPTLMNNPDYSPAVTNESYMFRSPPPSFTRGVHGR